MDENHREEPRDAQGNELLGLAVVVMVGFVVT
jgi:hypothetical protein